jgi:hypothetical protein
MEEDETGLWNLWRGEAVLRTTTQETRKGITAWTT